MEIHVAEDIQKEEQDNKKKSLQKCKLRTSQIQGSQGTLPS